MTEIVTLYRHPVKGLSPEAVDAAELVEGGYFPFDRLYAVENGPSGFDPARAEHMPKIKFLQLMRNARLARLETRFDPEDHSIEIWRDGAPVAFGKLASSAGRLSCERFLEGFLGPALRGPARLLAAPPGFRFTDSRRGFVSILNLATIDAIARAIGRESLDVRRFRGNIITSGWDAFAENDLLGRRLMIGEAELEVTALIDRCAAVDAEPGTGNRETDLVASLERHFSHHNCGVYAEVKRGGIIRLGDTITET